MSTARLTALRLVGFKSFAERTVIEFGSGISAVVGPNGSGKSNLADALRWTLGEQGRSLRARRAEDVIFAGSSSRKAVGMADVTLVIDNQDRLLPVDFGEVEISRRLYRSGENEYLLNRQRIRLRDLVDLLDTGNLADNAFLFIGQGMVDQALALRPEERRPLFEEAAGVRRHERRRRHAETELAEAEANLERVRDLLGELRPQARRLAAQAAQLEARRTAGLELAEALLSAARARWLAADEVERRETGALETARAAADKALVDLHAAEEAATLTSEQMANHADQERARRAMLDEQRAQIAELRVAEARLVSEISGLDRDAARIAAEREAVETRLREVALAASAAAPQPDPALSMELESLERTLAGIAGEREGSAGAGDTDEMARALTARRAEHEANRRRAEEADSDLAKGRSELERLSGRLREAEAERDAAVTALASAVDDEAQADRTLADARERSDAAASVVAGATEGVRTLEAESAAATAGLAALEATLESRSDEGLVRAARERGWNLVGEGLEVDARFRNAVSAALDDAASAFAVEDVALLPVDSHRGTLVLRGGAGRRSAPTAAGAAVLAAVREHGGGPLTDAIRRDPQGEVTRLLERAVWLPDLTSALMLRPSLQAGWRVVTVAGEVVTDEGVVRLSSGDGILEQRAERDTLHRRTSELDARLATEAEALSAAREAADSAAHELAAAQKRVDEARAARRTAEETERLAQRRAEQWLREVTWQGSQVDRLTAEAASAQDLAAYSTAEVAQLEGGAVSTRGDKPDADAAARLARLRARLDELKARKEAEETRISTWRQEQRVAEVRRAIDDTRRTELDAAQAQLSPRRRELSDEKSRLSTRLAEAELSAQLAAKELDAVLASGADDRSRLMQAERSAADARERLRVAEQQSRRSEVSQMEARLQLEQVREGLLVELAGIGHDAFVALEGEAGVAAARHADAASDTLSGDDYETALHAVIEAWRKAGVDSVSEPLGASRLGTLRRRFHELGAGNPFAAEEYAELRERLDAMEAQRADLETAITSTRELIASLSALITDQFRRTFAALEDAFGRRFQELFGGGDAELSLTAPEDLSATGIEIHARPPGKKRQPLSMLSGGERALTAVSLLLAMLEVRPVPFCVLDEVDAALDEANIGRFSKALRGLAAQTQFVVITHNRGTIEAADALYGVTLGDDAVSRVVSLRLPEAAAEPAEPTEHAEPAEPAEAAVA